MGALKDYIRDEISQEVQARGLVIWLDPKGEYTEFVSEQIEDQSLPFPLLSFDGSFLALMLELGPLLSKREQGPCLVHMPGFDDQDIKRTPLLEAFKAGKSMAPELLDHVKRAAAGKLSTQTLNHLLADPDFSLERADQRLSEEDETPEALKRLIGRHSLVDIALDLLSEERHYDELIEASPHLHGPLMLDYLGLQFGLDTSWVQDWLHGEAQTRAQSDIKLGDLQTPLAAYLMCVEYVRDLKVEPKMTSLKALSQLNEVHYQNACRVVEAFRDQKPQSYTRLALEVESLLLEEQEQSPDAYGLVDTFSFEEEKILDLAFQHLRHKAWKDLQHLVKQRLGHAGIRPSFWVEQDRNRRWAWQWLESITRLGRETERVAERITQWSSRTLSPQDMLSEYANQLYPLDQAHREFVQRAAQSKTMTQLKHFSQINDLGLKARQAYRDLIDHMTQLFNRACQHHGFLPSPEYQQRHFHAQVVAPMLAEQATVVFYIDAFRYELGQELARRFRQEKAEVKVQARLAELPTVTAVGMNALLPLSHDGQLTPSFDKGRGKFQGFRSGEKDIKGPKLREKLLKEQLNLPMQWLSLSELGNKTPQKLKSELKGKKLVVVHSLEIDELGETGLLDLIPNYFDETLNRLSSAVHRLQSCGFENFIFTADHGFIQADETLNRLSSAVHRLQSCGFENFIFTADHGFIQADETLRGEKLKHVELDTRRYALHHTQIESSQVTSVPLSKLSYKESDSWLNVPVGVDLFQKPKAKDSFFHGGNSLQERAIPVIVMHKKGAPNLQDKTQLNFDLVQDAPLGGLQRVHLTVTQSGQATLFEQQEVVLDLSTPQEQVVLNIEDIHPGQKQGNQITVELGKSYQILFQLHGQYPGKVPLQIAQPFNENALEAFVTDLHFEVQSTQSSKTETPTEAPRPSTAPTRWSSEIPAEYHPILTHLQTHGAITDGALSKMLGGGAKGGRKARRFASKIDGWLTLLPFDLHIVQTPEGKAYEVLQ